MSRGSFFDPLDGLGLTEGDQDAPDLSYDEWLIVERFGLDKPEPRMHWSEKASIVGLAVAVVGLMLAMVFL